MFLLLLACAPVPRHLAYDPREAPAPVPLLGGGPLVVGEAGTLAVRNASDHPLWLNEVRVVPEGAARIERSTGVTELAPDQHLVIEVEPRAPGAVLLRTSSGVRLVPIIAPDPQRPTPTGARSRDEIRQVMSGPIGLDECYRESRRRRRDLEGRLTVRFAIQADGGVADLVLVDSTFPSGKVETCVLDAVRVLKFPAAAAGTVVVTYPFTFLRDPAGDAAPRPPG